MYFSSLPIYIYAQASNDAFPAGSSNRLIHLSVTFPKGNGGSGTTHSFVHSAENGQTVTIDISSAHRAELQLAEEASAAVSPFSNGTFPVPPSSPATYAQVVSHITYTYNSAMVSLDDKSSILDPSDLTTKYAMLVVQARRGSLPETHPDASNGIIPSRLSLKPLNAGPELVPPGTLLRLGDATSAVAASAVEGSIVSTPSGTQAQVTDDPYLHTFYFLNQLGEIESVSCPTLESLVTKIKTTMLDIYRLPSAMLTANARAYKNNTPDSFKFSTGLLPLAWLMWFRHDFLLSPRHWLLISAQSLALTPYASQSGKFLLEVTVSPDDSQTIYDRSDGTVRSLSFTVTPAINGPIIL